MFRRSRIPAFAILAACVLAVSACANTSTSKRSTPAPKAAPTGAFDPTRPVTLALLAPSSAENAGAAQLGQAIANAGRMAMVDLNDQLVSLRVYDTAGRPETARAAMNQALKDGAKIILGPLLANNTKAIAAPAAEKGVKIISFSTDSSIAGGPIYLSGFLPEMESRRITSFARAKGFGNIGVFYPRIPAGQLALKGAKVGAGPSLTVQTGFERTEAGIVSGAQEFAQSVRANGARALFVPESGQALAFIMAKLGEQGLNSGFQYLGHGQWNTRSTLKARGARSGWFPAPDPAAMEAFVSKYRRAYGSVPPPLAVLGYDAVQIAGQMLAEARSTGSRDPFGAAALTRPQGFSGAVGPIRFGPDGLGERGLSILQVGQAVFDTIDPAPIAFGLGS